MENDQKATILNVDDDDAGRYAISRTLRQAGFDVKEASNGREALRLAEEQPDLIILDVNLPDINGFEVCRMIKNNPLTSHIPVLHLSATYLDDESKVRGLETADGYLTQPVEPPVLIATIKGLLRMKRAEKALRESEAKFRTLVEQIPAITYIAALDEVASTLYISPQIKTLLDFSMEEWLADPKLWLKQLHPDDRDRVLAEVNRTQATGEPFYSEYRLLTLDGRVLWFHDEAILVRNETGKPLFLQGVMIDITERKRSGEDLRKSELMLR
ncbi:MAG: response regulator, partial [Pseudomonadota bacterium]